MDEEAKMWFHIDNYLNEIQNPVVQSNLNQLISASVRVKQIIDNEIKQNLNGDASKLFIVGNCLGGGLAMYVGYTLPYLIGGVYIVNALPVYDLDSILFEKVEGK